MNRKNNKEEKALKTKIEVNCKTLLQKFLMDIRKERNIDKLQMSKALKITPSMISYLECGTRPASKYFKNKFYNAYKLSDSEQKKFEKACILSAPTITFNLKGLSFDSLELMYILYNNYNKLNKNQIHKIINIIK